MNMREYPTLQLDTNLSKVILFYWRWSFLNDEL